MKKQTEMKRINSVFNWKFSIFLNKDEKETEHKTNKNIQKYIECSFYIRS